MLNIGPWLEFLWENPQDSTAGLYQNLLLHQNNCFMKKTRIKMRRMVLHILIKLYLVEQSLREDLSDLKSTFEHKFFLKIKDNTEEGINHSFQKQNSA